MKELWDAGCEIRLMKLPQGGFARMHAKSLVVDDRVVFTGSVNMTHNGYENNKEHMFRIQEPAVLVQVVEDFEKDWRQSLPLTTQHMTMMMEKSEKAGQKRNQRQRSSRSANRSSSIEPSLHRSLSAELDEALVPTDG